MHETFARSSAAASPPWRRLVGGRRARIGAVATAALAGLLWAHDAGRLAPLMADRLVGGRIGTEPVRDDPASCPPGGTCDALTGCVAPLRAPEWNSELPPEGPSATDYRRRLEAFQACRDHALAQTPDTGAALLPATFDAQRDEAPLLAATLRAWNGDIFWAPASKASDRITRFGDEARAVFGPIPSGDCQASGAVSMPLEVNGNIVDIRPNPGKPGSPLEFQHRDASGRTVAWTTAIPRCDKPSLAGTVAFCGLNSRLSRVVRGTVEWLFFCRKSSRDKEVVSDPYWQRDDPRFAVYGVVGFNKASGEIVYFDGRKDVTSFDWSRPFGPPGGRSYADSTGRLAASQLYDPTFEVPCHSCHDNKSPFAVDPHAGLARVGYFLGEDDPAASAFSLGDILPLRPRSESSPFRIIGTAYTSTYSGDIARARTVRDPTGNCTGCHTLTTQTSGRRIAADSVAREPEASRTSWAERLELADETARFRGVAAHRTPWALADGAGMIHPWMVPGFGNELAALASPLSATDWRQLSDCLWGVGGAECGFRPLYTPCPAPESPAEGSAVLDMAVDAVASPDGAPLRRALRIRWHYLNSYGQVPARDDVRFDLVIRSQPVAGAVGAPGSAASPSMAELRAADARDPASIASPDGSLIRNVSYKGHLKWSEPAPGLIPRDFELLVPAGCGRRYWVRLLPKRFCFDQSGIAYGSKDHLVRADVACD